MELQLRDDYSLQFQQLQGGLRITSGDSSDHIVLKEVL